MTTPTLIGLTGPAGAGKTTAAEHIAETTGMHRLSFADPLKDMAAAFLGTSRTNFEQVYLHDRLTKEVPINGLGVSPRQILQTLGTEWGRNSLDPNIWVRLAQLRIGDLEDQATQGGDTFTGAIFDDVRFENEAAFIRAHGGVIIHIYHRQANKVRPHASEAGIQVDKHDYGIWNTGTLPAFRDDIAALVEMIQRDHAGRAA